MKMKVKVGKAYLKVEGDYSEVKEIITLFWDKNLSKILDAGAMNDSVVRTVNPQPDVRAEGANNKPPKHTKPKSKAGGTAGEKSSEQENIIANKIKAHEKFGNFNPKIILVSSDWIRKIQMVIYVSESSQHSGTISRVLTSVGVKNSLPTISKTLSQNKNLFITGGTSPETYDFTAASRNEFEEWLELE